MMAFSLHSSMNYADYLFYTRQRQISTVHHQTVSNLQNEKLMCMDGKGLEEEVDGTGVVASVVEVWACKQNGLPGVEASLQVEKLFVQMLPD